MKTRGTAVALLLAAALGLAQDKPMQDVSLTCKPPPPKEKSPCLTLNGTANFPEGTVLRYTLLRRFESYAGSKLILTAQQVGGGFTDVKGRKFQEAPAIPGPSLYTVQLALPIDMQKPALAAELKKVGAKSWEFQFPGWGDDLVGQLGTRLLELQGLSREAQDIVAKVEKAASTESGWIKEKKNVDARGADLVLTKEAEDALKDTTKLMTRIEKSDSKLYYPAAHSELFFSLQTMRGNAQHFVYESGKFAGAKSYHSVTDKLKTHRNEDFSFDNVKKYVEESGAIAGREFALWIVKDLRRTGCQLRGDITNALKNYGQQPGVSFVSDRLAQATAADLDAFEQEIRSLGGGAVKEEKKDDKKDEKKDEKAAAAADWDCPVCKKKNKASSDKCTATKDCKGKKPPASNP